MKKSAILAAGITATLAALPASTQTVPNPFETRILASGLVQPKGLDAALHGAGAGPMGQNVFVAESGLNRIVEVDIRTGVVTPVCPAADFPVGVACWGGPFAQYMYVGCAFSGGGIERISADGVGMPFALAGRNVAGLDFGKGPFGSDLYAGEWTLGNVWRVDPDGNETLFATVPGESRYLRFSQGGDFGHFLYVTDYATGYIHRIDPQGNVTLFAQTGAYGLEGLAFGPGGEFGKELYVGSLATGEIFRVAADGTVTLWATGFPGVADILFKPGGGGGFSMYFVDGNSAVHVISKVRRGKNP